jgi:hypothetical protein
MTQPLQRPQLLRLLLLQLQQKLLPLVELQEGLLEQPLLYASALLPEFLVSALTEPFSLAERQT